MILYSGHL